jgi:hypothetical protein
VYGAPSCAGGRGVLAVRAGCNPASDALVGDRPPGEVRHLPQALQNGEPRLRPLGAPAAAGEASGAVAADRAPVAVSSQRRHERLELNPVCCELLRCRVLPVRRGA